MAHKRKDTLVVPKEWAKHLKPDYKRQLAKAERQAAKKEFDRQFTEWNGNSNGSVGCD